MKRRLMFAAVLLLSFIAFAPGAATFTAPQAPAAVNGAPPEYGPAKGNLVIVGAKISGTRRQRDTEFTECSLGFCEHGFSVSRWLRENDSDWRR